MYNEFGRWERHVGERIKRAAEIFHARGFGLSESRRCAGRARARALHGLMKINAFRCAELEATAPFCVSYL
jgi:hypothetical protein